MMDELDQMRDKAARAAAYEKVVAALIAKVAPPKDAKLLLRLPVTDQLDWARARIAPPDLTPPPPEPAPDPLARAKEQKRKQHQGSF